ncbi:hypothetical protein L1987_44662 [Smallanthus sonchifolius]|uniref:Uncharacterized protein n=1 Tax=Smallanthus sonchifolius TaxID=185202 RepID=A0ACB9GPT9_9ASTR|nr:hypothetical protein L1987_44662 [Smallanthus sonchifolius]
MESNPSSLIKNKPKTRQRKPGLPHPPGSLPRQTRRRRQDPQNLSLRHQNHPILRRHTPTHPLHRRLKTFESSVGLSRKAFRLGKFIQDINSFRSAKLESKQDTILAIIAYGGEGLYYFVEQFVWLAKSGLIDGKHSRNLQRISAWAEFIGYVGSISLKVRDLRGILKDEAKRRS